ncbi:hypothetical protein ACFWY5_52520 [Nonomuraea sp. NPDC059007]|uniref:hypothetical protein n=1 Tax=Nonomuraea sp. NPDC059007 TaxID=3346692 RepID=UPI00368E9C39
MSSLLTLALAGCGPAESPQRAGATPAPATAKPYTVNADEPARPVKRAAVAYLEALFTFGAGEGSLAASRARMAALKLPVGPVTRAAGQLDGEAAGAIQMIYPQLGGLTADRASIMAVVRLSRQRGPELVTRTRTVDVRLAKRVKGWTVTGLASLGGTAPRDAESGTPARRVLASGRIVLPDSARWDVQAGRIDDRVLRMLLRLSREHRISVAVLASGHPAKVFGSMSTSNHTRGRAVDIWAIDGRRVAAHARDKGPNPARTLMETAIRYGSDEVGGPWAFRGAFTDAVHQDHLHIGFKRP